MVPQAAHHLLAYPLHPLLMLHVVDRSSPSSYPGSCLGLWRCDDWSVEKKTMHCRRLLTEGSAYAMIVPDFA
jgi:hypothetical protein